MSFFAKNKALIEVTAIFYAILGVFLNIQNLDGNIYLQNIQGVLLLAASVCSIVLIFKGSLFIIYIEKDLGQKLDMDFSGLLYAIFVGFQTFIVSNLWFLIIHSYRNALKDVLNSMELYVGMFALYLSFGVGKKIFLLFTNGRIGLLFFSVLSLLVVILGSFVILMLDILDIYLSGVISINVFRPLIFTALLVFSVLLVSFIVANKQQKQKK